MQPGGGRGADGTGASLRIRGMGGGEDERGGDASQCQRQAGIGCGGERGGHAGHDLAGDARCGERLHLLARAAEDHRISGLEPHDPPSSPSMAHHQGLDVPLSHCMVALALADEDTLRFGRDQIQDVGGDEGVVKHDVGVLQGAERADGQQVGRARACADDPDAATLRPTDTREQQAAKTGQEARCGRRGEGERADRCHGAPWMNDNSTYTSRIVQ